MARKKISRKQLLKEPDQFLTFSSRMINRLAPYRRQILWGSVAFFGVIIAVALYNYISSQSQAEAFALLDQAAGKYQAALGKDGPQKALETVSGDFEKILDDHGGQAGGHMARVVYADICFRGGKIDQAIALYTQALDDYADQPFYLNRIRASLAHALTEKKAYQAAADQLQQILQETSPAMADEALFHLGAIYAMMGQESRSREQYQRIVSEHSDSIYLELAKEKMRG